MKTFHSIVFLMFSLALMSSAAAQDTATLEGKVVTSSAKNVGAFTVKAYAVGTDSGSTSPAARGKAVAQTLTRADGSYSLSISGNLKVVLLRCEKLSYFSVPPEQTVPLILPKTTVPDVVAVEYSYGQNVSARDLREALSMRETSINKILVSLPAKERESARNKIIESDLESLRKSKVDPATILGMKNQFLPQ